MWRQLCLRALWIKNDHNRLHFHDWNYRRETVHPDGTRRDVSQKTLPKSLWNCRRIARWTPVKPCEGSRQNRFQEKSQDAKARIDFTIPTEHRGWDRGWSGTKWYHLVTKGATLSEKVKEVIGSRGVLSVWLFKLLWPRMLCDDFALLFKTTYMQKDCPLQDSIDLQILVKPFEFLVSQLRPHRRTCPNCLMSISRASQNLHPSNCCWFLDQALLVTDCATLKVAVEKTLSTPTIWLVKQVDNFWRHLWQATLPSWRWWRPAR